MPYENERSEGYALIQIENSEALREFNGTILTKEAERVDPTIVSPNRRG